MFIRSLVGLDRAAAREAFADFLDPTRHNDVQIRFIELVIDELTRHGVMEARRLYESPYTDAAACGPDAIFADSEVEAIVTVLDDVRRHAVPSAAADAVG